MTTKLHPKDRVYEAAMTHISETGHTPELQSSRATFQYMKRTYRMGSLRRACSNRTRSNGFKLDKGIFTLDIKEEIHIESGKILKQIAQGYG